MTICLLASGAGAQDSHPARFDRPVGPEGPDERLFQEAVLFYVNVERRRAGQRSLANDAKLARVAAGHAANMAAHRLMSHRLAVPKGGKLVERLQGNGVPYRRAGENIAMDKAFRLVGRPISTRAVGCAFTYADTGEPVPRHTHASLATAAVTRWMNSKGHRDNILDPNFRRMGAGAAIDPGGPACGDVYLAQNFTG
ncbi:CAP domain-containing protein [Amaricoccus sp.]|uniref:CAP domain-containing protein n=1 Tax=Amaricoccus sp. TaxID=1872485 RepID=UPI001B3DCD69|nr:CAP domain-containing protein [Amaricoccus sp.]MBP7240809.1 hypothetical protein [Amaricoccus sp.]